MYTFSFATRYTCGRGRSGKSPKATEDAEEGDVNTSVATISSLKLDDEGREGEMKTGKKRRSKKKVVA